MKFSEIKSEWDKDCVINPQEVGLDSLNTQKLHTKYLNILTKERYLLRQLQGKQDCLERDLFEYYLGDAPASVYKSRPLNRRILKTDVPKYIRRDQQTIDLAISVAAMEEKVEYLKSIISMLNNRRWEIKNYIDWAKFKSGVV